MPLKLQLQVEAATSWQKTSTKQSVKNPTVTQACAVSPDSNYVTQSVDTESSYNVNTHKSMMNAKDTSGSSTANSFRGINHIKAAVDALLSSKKKLPQ